MADLGNRANVNAAIDLLLDDLQPDDAIQPSDHNGLLMDILDTLSNGLSTTLRTANTTGGFNIEVTDGDTIDFDKSGFTGTVNPLVLTSNRQWDLPDQSGTVALLSDLTGSLFSEDGQILTGNRVHNGAGFVFGLTDIAFGITGVDDLSSTLLASFQSNASNDVAMLYNDGKVIFGASLPIGLERYSFNGDVRVKGSNTSGSTTIMNLTDIANYSFYDWRANGDLYLGQNASPNNIYIKDSGYVSFENITAGKQSYVFTENGNDNSTGFINKLTGGIGTMAFLLHGNDATVRADKRGKSVVSGAYGSDPLVFLHTNAANACEMWFNISNGGATDHNITNSKMIIGNTEVKVTSGTNFVSKHNASFELGINASGLSLYADDTAAGVGGLVTGDLYVETTSGNRYISSKS